MLVTNPYGKIWLALKGRLAQWTECRVVMPNETFHPNANTVHIIAQNVVLTTSDGKSIDLNCREKMTGTLNLSVLVPTNTGYDAHIGLAGRVADHFALGDKYTYQDMTVEINSRSQIIGNSTLQAPWNRLEVQAYWTSWG